jgi:hypothetical protein
MEIAADNIDKLINIEMRRTASCRTSSSAPWSLPASASSEFLSS